MKNWQFFMIMTLLYLLAGEVTHGKLNHVVCMVGWIGSTILGGIYIWRKE